MAGARRKVAVLVSGRGSNMRSLIAAARDPDYPAEIVHVLSNVPGAPALDYAAEAGIATSTLDHRTFDGRAEFDEALDARLRETGAELICLAGFMRLLGEDFVARWADRILNIHPSLLPAFKGLHVHERVLEAGVRFTGCTVHIVRPAMDDGPIVVQAAVPVHADDTPESLAARVLSCEHEAYPLALALVAAGRVHIQGVAAIIDGAPAPERSLMNPTGLPDA